MGRSGRAFPGARRCFVGASRQRQGDAGDEGVVGAAHAVEVDPAALVWVWNVPTTIICDAVARNENGASSCAPPIRAA